MKLAIIGAGVSGLASARYAVEYNLDFVIFEATNHIGGTWVYLEETPTDEHNVPFHSSIYELLRTNTPAPATEFNGFRFETECNSSYPSHTEVLQYIENFAEKFSLRKYIKFQHQVQNITKESTYWKIKVMDLQNKNVFTENFDAVMICNGHWAKPAIPYIPGIETFSGDQIHSYKYRNNKPYKNKRVLIIGTGPSGLEISLECAEIASKAYLSYRSEPIAIFHENLEYKPNILRMDSNFVTFVDETSVEIDSIILCTGYEFYFPFLDESCGMDVLEKHIVRPLFKRFINIRHPTMCFIGLIKESLIFPIVDLQAKFFVKSLADEIQLPSTDLMLQSEIEEHEQNVSANKYHWLGADMEKYVKDLINYGKMETLPEVNFKIYNKSKENRKNDFGHFRQYKFEIVDDKTFTITSRPNCKSL